MKRASDPAGAWHGPIDDEGPIVEEDVCLRKGSDPSAAHELATEVESHLLSVAEQMDRITPVDPDCENTVELIGTLPPPPNDRVQLAVRPVMCHGVWNEFRGEPYSSPRIEDQAIRIASPQAQSVGVTTDGDHLMELDPALRALCRPSDLDNLLGGDC